MLYDVVSKLRGETRKQDNQLIVVLAVFSALKPLKALTCLWAYSAINFFEETLSSVDVSREVIISVRATICKEQECIACPIH